MSFNKFYSRKFGEDVGVEETAPAVVPEVTEEVTETKKEPVDVTKMTKAELDAYASEEFKITLDRRKSFKSMLKDFEKAKSTK